MAAALGSGREAVLSHRSAGELWKLTPPSSSQVDITSPPGRRARRAGIVCHEAVLAVDEVTVEDGIPVTTPPRTVFDCASSSSPRQLERLFHELEVRQIRDALSIPDLITRHPGHQGVVNLRILLGANGPRITWHLLRDEPHEVAADLRLLLSAV